MSIFNLLKWSTVKTQKSKWATCWFDCSDVSHSSAASNHVKEILIISSPVLRVTFMNKKLYILKFCEGYPYFGWRCMHAVNLNFSPTWNCMRCLRLAHEILIHFLQFRGNGKQDKHTNPTIAFALVATEFLLQVCNKLGWRLTVYKYTSIYGCKCYNHLLTNIRDFTVKPVIVVQLWFYYPASMFYFD